MLDFGTEIKVFYGQLTNLNFQLKVTDTVTGRTKTYTNTTGDCGAIDPDFSKAAALTAPAGLSEDDPCSNGPGAAPYRRRRSACSTAASASPSSWQPAQQHERHGRRPAAVDADRGLLVYRPGQPRILVKTLDFGDKFLVLYGSLSNLEYTLHVTDTVSGVSKNYLNPAGNYCGGIDTTSFPK